MSDEQKSVDPSSIRFGIVASRFNEFITAKLARGAREALQGRGVTRIEEVWVPGAFELPLACCALAGSGKFDALVCVGCVVRGETYHFEVIAEQAGWGILTASLDTRVPIGFGLLTVDTAEQALERAGGRHGNKGAEAAEAALEMLSLLNRYQLT